MAIKIYLVPSIHEPDWLRNTVSTVKTDFSMTTILMYNKFQPVIGYKILRVFYRTNKMIDLLTD